MSLAQLCTREIHLADPDDSVLEAAVRMSQRGVGSLLILDGNKKPVGIVTDRDLVIRVMAQGLSAENTKVWEVMTGDIQTISDEAVLEDVIERMKTGSIRRLPVVDNEGALLGLIALDDAVRALVDRFSGLREVLHRQRPKKLVLES